VSLGRQSGLADLLPSLPDRVWVGVSAPDDRTLGVVDFAIFPT
jgi:dipeptidase E